MDREYQVTWRIDVSAKNEYEAACYARRVQLDPLSTATFFEVADLESGSELEIDSAADQVICKLCNEYCEAKHSHLHQGEYVGECCWDERLRTTE